MKQKNTKELDDILGKTHISDFDKFCVEQKGSMDPEQNAFSEYIKDLLKEKKITQQMVFLKAVFRKNTATSFCQAKNIPGRGILS